MHLHDDLPRGNARHEVEQRRQLAAFTIYLEQRDFTALEAPPALGAPVLVVELHGRWQVGSQRLPLADERSIKRLNAAVRRTPENVRFKGSIAVAAHRNHVTGRRCKQLLWVAKGLAGLATGGSDAFQLGASGSVRTTWMPPILEVAAHCKLRAQFLQRKHVLVCNIIEALGCRRQNVAAVGGLAEFACNVTQQQKACEQSAQQRCRLHATRWHPFVLLSLTRARARAARAYRARAGALLSMAASSSHLPHAASCTHHPTTIAIVLSGFARDYHRSLSTLGSKLVKPNRGLGHHVCIAAFTWDIIGTRLTAPTHIAFTGDDRYDEREWKPTVHLWRNTSISRALLDAAALGRALDRVGADRVVFELGQFDRVSRQWTCAAPGREFIGRFRSCHQVITKLSMLYGVHRSFQLLGEHQVHADVVIRARYDVHFMTRVLIEPSSNATAAHATDCHAIRARLGAERGNEVVQLDPCESPAETKRTATTGAGRLESLLALQLKTLHLDPNATRVRGLGCKASAATAVAMPIRLPVGPAEDMVALGLYAGMAHYCSAFERADEIIDRLWGLEAGEHPFRGEDMFVLNAALTGTQIRTMPEFTVKERGSQPG